MRLNRTSPMVKRLPFEQAVLGGIGSMLQGSQRDQFAAQVSHINKVQRLLNWREIEFYCMRWLKVRWPSAIRFQRREEFELGCGVLLAHGATAHLKVWAAGGHVFSIESESSLKPFPTAADVSFSPAAERER
jgi:hypothetical protein